METAIRPERPEGGRSESTAPGQPGPRTTAEAAQILERALAQVESMPRDLAELKRSLGEVFQQLYDALSHLGMEAGRLADESSRLGAVAGRLEERLNQLPGLAGEGQPPEAAPPAPAEPPVPEEPTFWGEGALAVVLAAVPGFQGLMDAQGALSALPEAAGPASVLAYKNGEASLEVSLRAPVSARQIVERLRESTGHSLLIEESRPEVLRLRLRFVVPEGRR